MELVIKYFCYIYSCYWIFQGLNGFFNWIKIPFVSHEMGQFIGKLNEIPAMMFSIKCYEVLIGILLIINPELAFILLGPLVLGIILIQNSFNPKPYGIISTVIVPYVVLLLFILQKNPWVGLSY